MNEKEFAELRDLTAPLYGEHLAMRAILVEMLRKYPVDLAPIERMVARMDSNMKVRDAATRFMAKLKDQLAAD